MKASLKTAARSSGSSRAALEHAATLAWAAYQALTVAVGVSVIVSSSGVGVVVAFVSGLPLPLAVLLGLVVAMLCAIGLGLWDKWRSPEADEPLEGLAQAPRQAPPGRVGIRNTGRGQSVSHGATFGSDLDTAIENRDDGRSEDYGSTFE